MALVPQMWLIAGAWAVLIYLTARLCAKSRDGSVGLPLSYLLTMTFLHIGSLTYLVPGYSHLRYDAHFYLRTLDFTEDMVLQGTIASLLTVLGLFIGTMLVRGGKMTPESIGPKAIPLPANRTPLLINLLILSSIGFIGGFVAVASIQSIIVILRNLAVVTVCLGLWISLRRDDRTQFTRWVVVSGAIPMIYLIVYGFFSYGFAALAMVFAFWLSVPRPNKTNSLKVGAIVAGTVYLTFSMFVSYMDVRDYLRSVIWSDRGDSTIVERLGAAASSLSQAHFFNPLDFNQLDWFNVRLNQNLFIGQALAWHGSHPGLDENGRTFVFALFAWVPRFLWSDKPEMGGSHFVADHTGHIFSRAVAIASGPTFEFVINFRMLGALVGGVALGIILRLLDRGAVRALKRKDYARFIRLMLIGAAVVAPTSPLFFIVAAVAASWVVGTGIMFWMKTDVGRDPALVATGS